MWHYADRNVAIGVHTLLLKRALGFRAPNGFSGGSWAVRSDSSDTARATSSLTCSAPSLGATMTGKITNQQDHI